MIVVIYLPGEFASSLHYNEEIIEIIRLEKIQNVRTRM